MMDRLAELFDSWASDFVVLTTGLMTLSMGMWLILPMETFAVSPNWKFAAGIAPDWAWGLIISVPGAIKAYGILRADYKIAKLGCAIAFNVWLFLSLEFFLSNPRSSMVPILLWIATINAWFVLQMGYNGRQQDKGLRRNE